jgi:membrane dipeptidase
VFQLVESGSSALGGAAATGDDRGLSQLGRALLDRLAELVPSAGRPGPRPVVDLANLNNRTTADVLAWFEADEEKRKRLLVVRSHGAIDIPDSPATAGISGENLRRLRALGGVIGLSVGLPYVSSTDALRAAIESAASVPFEGRTGYEGIGIGTDFINLEQPLSQLENAPRVTEWLAHTFSMEVASSLADGTGRNLLLRSGGCVED